MCDCTLVQTGPCLLAGQLSIVCLQIQTGLIQNKNTVTFVILFNMLHPSKNDRFSDGIHSMHAVLHYAKTVNENCFISDIKMAVDVSAALL